MGYSATNNKNKDIKIYSCYLATNTYLKDGTNYFGPQHWCQNHIFCTQNLLLKFEALFQTVIKPQRIPGRWIHQILKAVCMLSMPERSIQNTADKSKFGDSFWTCLVYRYEIRPLKWLMNILLWLHRKSHDNSWLLSQNPTPVAVRDYVRMNDFLKGNVQFPGLQKNLLAQCLRFKTCNEMSKNLKLIMIM